MAQCAQASSSCRGVFGWPRKTKSGPVATSSWCAGVMVAWRGVTGDGVWAPGGEGSAAGEVRQSDERPHANAETSTDKRRGDFFFCD